MCYPTGVRHRPGGGLDRSSGLSVARPCPARFPGLVSHEHLTRGTSGFLLLRPDGYVAAGGLTRADLDAVEPLLAGLLP